MKIGVTASKLFVEIALIANFDVSYGNKRYADISSVDTVESRLLT